MATSSSNSATVRKTGPTGRRALGKGLGSLLSPTAVPMPPKGLKTKDISSPPGLPGSDSSSPDEAFVGLAEGAGSEQSALKMLSLEQIAPNVNQPRRFFAEEEIEQLANSIEQSGLLQPIIVRKDPEDLSRGQFQIVAGERRWRAACRIGLKQVPVIVKELSDQECLELGIVENVQRADLSPIEEACAYRRLAEEFGQSQSEIAQCVGKDRASIANTMRLLKLSSEEQAMIGEGRISAGHGRALLSLESSVLRQRLLDEIIGQSLSVRAAEARAKELNERGGFKVAGKATPQSSTRDPAVEQLETRLRRALGTKVQVKVGRDNRGEIRISFFSQQELETLLEALNA